MRPCHINRRSRSKYARNRFERALDNVVRVFTRKLFHVQRNFRLTHERKPKFFVPLVNGRYADRPKRAIVGEMPPR